ncbi:hypothetical protein CEJ86_29885 [Sinorhizobium meliloti]|uniref:ACT domain-containing protein n=1 Tax=Rhizobium meliloti TaxID=382 RepID=A0A2J0YU82_RHIML|nr:hypothetical protein CEJ86_29885 [Sinorhizobium meliloti]
MKQYVITVSCKLRRGIVAAISDFLASQGCNIVDSSQFDDLDTGMFFMRVSFVSEEGADQAKLIEGFKTNVQEQVVIHTDPGFPASVGEGCTIGHRAILHGCSIGDNSLIGMGAIV